MHTFPITGVILAGGRGSRLGGRDKGLLEIAGRPLIEHLIGALMPQVDSLLISANRNLDRYATYGLPVIEDATDGYLGPLAGILSALRAAQSPYILTVPCDSPLLPAEYATRMHAALTRQHASLCVAHDGMNMQPAFALLSRGLVESIDDYLASGERKLQTWLADQHPAFADFSDQPQMFININTPHDLAQIQQRFSTC